MRWSLISTPCALWTLISHEKVRRHQGSVVFAWEVVWGQILTDGNLMRGPWLLMNGYILCKPSYESVNDIHIHCNKNQLLWAFSLATFGMQWVSPKSVKELLMGWKVGGMDKQRRKLWPDLQGGGAFGSKFRKGLYQVPDGVVKGVFGHTGLHITRFCDKLGLGGLLLLSSALLLFLLFFSFLLLLSWSILDTPYTRSFEDLE